LSSAAKLSAQNTTHKITNPVREIDPEKLNDDV